MNELVYIQSATSLVDEINRYDAIITALTDQALIAAGDSNISEYSLDDGQVKIKTIYRDVASIAKAIKDFSTLRGIALNKLNGKIIILKSPRGLM